MKTRREWVDYLVRLAEEGVLAKGTWVDDCDYCAVGHIALEYGIDALQYGTEPEVDEFGDDYFGFNNDAILYRLNAVCDVFTLEELRAILDINDHFANDPTRFGAALREVIQHD